MNATTTSRTRRIMHRIAATWSELDHAQRRVFELQTGLPSGRRGRSAGRHGK